MKKWIGAALCLLLVVVQTPRVVALPDLSLNALSAVVMEASTGRILYEKNAYEQRPMASTTKVMTLIVALEADCGEELATVSELAAKQPEVHMDMRAGEQYRMQDLYYAMMLESWNDTAVVIAEHISGSVAAFCELMTQKAREIGAMHTQFKTPNGLDAQGHYTTAADLARIMAYAMENEEFRQIINTQSYTIRTEDGNSRSVTVHNHNPMLGSYVGTTGGKTGYTNEAGLCLVTSAQRDGVELIAVVLASGWPPHSKYRVADAAKLLDLGFENFAFEQIVSAGTPVEEMIEVAGGTVDYVNAHVSQDFSYFVTEEDQVELICDLPYSLQAPIRKGDLVGAVTVLVNDTPVAVLEVLADQDCAIRNLQYYWKKLLYYYTYI
ncbi:MAG: D-alanyl-D-alanine carboxypeptidase [Firmicutes bacterium]|nr:D-alanyl-D-alanine carboxypeptidase [Bacillota bacterium]